MACKYDGQHSGEDEHRCSHQHELSSPLLKHDVHSLQYFIIPVIYNLLTVVEFEADMACMVYVLHDLTIQIVFASRHGLLGITDDA